MRIKVCLCLAGLLLISWLGCDNQRVLLDKDQYRDIILDLQVAETIILNSQLRNKDSLRQALQQRICEIYGFKDIAGLKESLMPLESNPELMLEITKEMSKKLDQLADSVSRGVE